MAGWNCRTPLLPLSVQERFTGGTISPLVMMKRALLAMIALLAAAPAVSAQAFPGRDSWAPKSREEQAGEVPLSDILRDLRNQYGGQHVDARRSGDTYEIVWIAKDGRRMVFQADARTGRIRMVRGG